MTSSSHTVIQAERSDFRRWTAALKELAAKNLAKTSGEIVGSVSPLNTRSDVGGRHERS